MLTAVEGGLGDHSFCPFDLLPNELVHHILYFVGSRWLLTSAHAVCRRWNHISHIVPVHVEVVDRCFSWASTHDAVPATMPVFVTWVGLTRDARSEAFGNWLLQIVTRFKRVQKLASAYMVEPASEEPINMWCAPSDKTLADIIRLCPDLRHSDGFVSPLHARIADMALGSFLRTDDIAKAIATSCQKLTHLTIGPRPNVAPRSQQLLTNNGLRSIAAHCHGLTSVTIKYCALSDIGVLARCKRLTNLCFYESDGVDDVCLSSFGNACRLLRKLDICGCTNVTDDGIGALCVVERPCLLYIRIVHAKVTDTGVRFLAQACPNLIEIEMENIGLTDTGLTHFGTHCKKLACVILEKVGVTDVGIATLESMSNLTDVCCVDCNRITDNGVDVIRHSCKGWGLKSLLITGQRYLTESSRKYFHTEPTV